MKHFMKSVMSLMLGLMCFASCSEDTPEEEHYFTVSFNSMGGSEVEAQSVKAGEYAVKPENPTKEDMAFTGWYTSEKYESQWDFAGDAVNSDMTLYAKWIASDKVCTVTFETNGGNKVDPMKVEKGCALSYLPVPEKEGFLFDGWYKEPSFTTQYEIGTKVNADITLYAKWKAESDDAVRKLLEGLIAEAEGLKQGDYTENSYKLVQDALKAAKEVIAKTDATTEELQKAYDDLKKNLDNLFPAVEGKPYTISFDDGELWENKYVVINSLYNDYLSLEFDILDKGGNSCDGNAGKIKFTYDKAHLAKWAQEGSINEYDTHITMYLNGNMNEGDEIPVKATSVLDPSISMTVILKVYKSDWINGQFVDVMNKLPDTDGITLDNYIEVLNGYNSACALYQGILSGDIDSNFALKTACEKLDAYSYEMDDTWYHSPFIHIKDDVYYLEYEVAKYTSNGDKFPGGVFISDFNSFDGGIDGFYQKLEFVTSNEYVVWYMETLNGNEGIWEKEVKCEYKYIQGEDGIGMLISHVIEDYYEPEGRMASSVKRLLGRTVKK